MGEPQAKNRREYFRITFVDLFGTMQIVEVGGRPITVTPRAMRIIDASGGGLSITSDDDLPIRKGILGLFEFTVGQFNFSFKGTLIRKTDDMRSYHYGVRFVEADEKHRGLLLGVLGRIQVERNSKSGGL